MRGIIRSARVIALCGLICACAVPYRGGARAVQPTQLDNATWYQAAETPVVLQKQMTDCGLAALAMVAGAWGRHWSIDDLAHRSEQHTSELQSRGLISYA